MRHALTITAVLAIPSLMSARATDLEEGHVFSGVETMIFQNGISPTPDYAGIRLLGISSDSAAVTKGNLSWPGDSLVWIGDVHNAAGEDRLLFSMDIGPGPDSAMIGSATLYLLKTNSVVSTVFDLHANSV